MRAAELVVDPKQYSLQQAFERAVAQAGPAGATLATTGGAVSSKAAPAAAAAPQEFDIHSDDSATEIGAESMCVVGQNPGEKRKQEHLQDAERISQRGG